MPLDINALATPQWLDLFQNNLINWYDQHYRNLPWRQNTDPYRIWISEIMLQQTQVKKVVPYFNRFITTFPSLVHLAQADLSAVLKAWEGMGYYARARNLHKAARMIASDMDGVFPRVFEDMMRLPGIGPYTAAAISSIAFGSDRAVVDGNVNRVLARLFRIETDPKSIDGKNLFQKTAEHLLAKGRAGSYNQALMELGALLCKPKNPKCELCPVSAQCRSFADHVQHHYPVRRPAKKRPHYKIAIGLAWKQNKLLITRRPEDAMLGGLWEFPGGKIKDKETPEQAVVREFAEEVDIQIKVIDQIAVIDHAYTHFSITVHAFRCEYVSGKTKCKACTDFKWVYAQDLKDFAFPRANRKILEKLDNMHSSMGKGGSGD